jgi:hypothetical protein
VAHVPPQETKKKESSQCHAPAALIPALEPLVRVIEETGWAPKPI